MRKFLLISALSLIGASMLAGCDHSEPEKPDSELPDIPLPPIPEKVPTLSSLMSDLVVADNVLVTLKGTGKTTMHIPGGDRIDNSGTVDRTISFSDDLYYVEEPFNSELNHTDYVVDFIGGGYFNKDNKINAFSMVSDEFQSSGQVANKFTRYQDAIYTFDDLNLTNLKDFEGNVYNLDLTVAPFIEAPNNPVDFNNFEVIADILKIGQRQDIIDSMTLQYNEDSRKLEVIFTTNYKEQNLIFKGDYLATIEIGKADLDGLRKYCGLSDFKTPANNAEFDKIQDLLETGYRIDDFPVNMSDGNTLNGKLYVTKDYYVLDYTQDSAELLDGFFVRDGGVYDIGLTNDGNLSTNMRFTPEDLKVLSDDLGKEVTAYDMCNLLGATKTGTVPIYASFAGRKGSPYAKELEAINKDFKIFEVDDFGGVLGMQGEVESVIPVTLLYPGFTPLGYTITQNLKQNTIDIGWQAFGDLNGKTDIYGSRNVMSISNFGATHKTMEKLIKLHQN